MSNNQMVSVPREPTEEMIVAFAEAWYSKRQTIDDPDMLDAYAAMLAVAPAEQHQGEPVAWRVGSQIFQQEHLAKMHSGGVRKPVEPLYTHADPAEVERLRERIAGQHDRFMLVGKLSDAAFDKLAERDALLQKARDDLAEWANAHPNARSVAETDLLIGQIDCALAASAEPSAPAWSCQSCQLEQPTDRPCDACGGQTALISGKS